MVVWLGGWLYPYPTRDQTLGLTPCVSQEYSAAGGEIFFDSEATVVTSSILKLSVHLVFCGHYVNECVRAVVQYLVFLKKG